MIKQYTKADGSKAYMVKVYLGIDPITGKEKRTTRRGFKTERDAKLAEAKLIANIQENGFSSPSKDMTFEEAYKGWLEEYSLTVRESTLNVVTALINGGILPELGNWKVKKITRRKAQRLVKDWHSKYKTFRKYKCYASKIMDYALEEGAIKSNPFDKVKNPISKPMIKDDNDKFYTKKELQTFLSFVEDDPMYYAIFRTLAFTGLRKGELMALQWSDINFEKQSISVSKTVTYGDKSRQIVGPPKTPSSNRIVKLDDNTIQALRRWKLEQKTALFKLGHNCNKPDQFVFTNVHTNELLSKMTITHKLWSLCEENKFKKITLHGFRHTCCSLLFEAGLGIKEVQDVMGHSNVKTTLDIYAHVTKDNKINSARKLSEYVNF